LWVIDDWPMPFAGSRPVAWAASSNLSPMSTRVFVVGWIEANVRFGPISATYVLRAWTSTSPTSGRASMSRS
jgi:hypothetical protein